MEKEISFGAWLYKHRRASDLTRKALASQVGCAEVTLRRIENDTLKPSKELALILLEKLGITENDRLQWVQFARGLTGYPEQPVDSSPTKPLTNLPSLLTTFIGREKEQAEIIKHLNKYRLVTLTGSGGVGKTRLSIKVGEQVLGDYPHGAWLLELAPLNDPALLLQTVAALFGLVTQPNTPLAEKLGNFLHTKTILLILDNCEHLLDACAQLADTLLKICPNLKILATSREPLGITGEAIYRVPSLGLPHVEQMLETLREFESVRLFEERAQLVQMGFSLTLENASSVAQICSRLDGLPLALELAAAKIHTFSAGQIAEQLEESFNLLTGGNRTSLPRQQTIRASIDWSWDLLSDSERILLRRLTVFAGGWTLEAAESVCGNGDGVAVLELTSQLVAKSLISANQLSWRTTRFHLHEMIRQYAHEKLVEAGEEENIRNQHLQYFRGLSELAEPALRGPQQTEWVSRINDERGNIRGALEQAARSNLEAGLYLAGGLMHYWRNYDLREGLGWTTEFVQRPESQTYPHGRAKALLVQGNILWGIQDFASARSAAEECLALFRACGDRQGEFEGLMLMGSVTQFLEGMDEKVEFQKQALALAQSIGDVWMQAVALSGLGWDQRNPQQARQHWEKAIALLRQVGDWRSLVDILSVLGYTILLNGDLESAQKLLDEAWELNRNMNYKRGMEFVLTGKSYIALIRGEHGQARAFLQENAEVLEEVGNRMGYLWARARLGGVTLREGNIAEAQHILNEIVESFHKDRNKSGLAFALDKMASLQVVLNKSENAARLTGWSDATRKEIGYPRPLLEQTDVDCDLTAIVAKIGTSAFEIAYAEGCAMTLDEAVVLATDKIRL